MDGRPASPAPLTVLMTADAVGGVWRYSLELAGALAPLGVQTVLAVMGPAPNRYQVAAALRVPGLTLAVRELPLEWMPECRERDLEEAGEWLLDLADRVRAALVHLNGYAQATLPWRRPTLVVAHSCVLSWWRAVHGQTVPPEWRPYAERVKRGLVAADVVVSPTAAFRDELTCIYGGLGSNRVIWNGVAAKAFAPVAKEDFVLGAGRLWDAAKNAAALDRVAPRLPWPVRIAGERTDLGGEVAKLSAAEPLGMLDPLELAAWMARARVFASPARYEPFGLGILEAALSGCALVLGDIPTLRELWDGSALFVDPADDVALAGALLELTRSPARCATMGAAARERGLTFSAAAMAQHYRALYAELCLAPAV